ncbi:MAG: hypothetical protein AAB217_26355, partial [Chloroflexota bacterium]
ASSAMTQIVGKAKARSMVAAHETRPVVHPKSLHNLSISMWEIDIPQHAENRMPTASATIAHVFRVFAGVQM